MKTKIDDVRAAIEVRDAAVLAGRHTANRDLADVLRREIEASSVAEVARRAGWSRTTIYSLLESYPEES